MMKYYDLFEGIGGFRLGMDRAGHECVGGCEIDEFARQVYAKHFGTAGSGDVTKLDPKNIYEFPDFDCLCAGFPCQAFSIAGRRLGFEESRGTLFYEIARIAKQKRPRLLFLENVKGLLSHNRGKTFAVILSTLDELGYDVQGQVLNSKYWVPQNRERIFIIGHLRGTPRPEVFPLGTFPPEAERKSQDRQISTAIDSNYWKGIDNHGQRTIIKLGKINDGDSGRVLDPQGIAQCLKAVGGGHGAKTGLYAISTSGRKWGREGRMKPDEANRLRETLSQIGPTEKDQIKASQNSVARLAFQLRQSGRLRIPA